MFGYVRPALSLLPEEEKERYQGAYCGLCHAMGRRHGFLARFTLSYDFAFLAVLFTTGEEMCWQCRHCPTRPLGKKRRCLFGPGLDAAADASMILTYHKLRDDIADSGFFRGLLPRFLCLLLRRGYCRAERKRPEFARCTAEELYRLRMLEREGAPSIDRTADAFAAILRAAVPPNQSEEHRRAMEQVLYHVGRWVYLTDAWDDLKDDREHRRYNPLIARFGGEAEKEKDYISTTMTHSLNLARSAANLIPFGTWGAVVENILCQGLPAVQSAVLSGQWKQLKKKHREKNR